ncbi:MAG: hypothetical protein LAQ30_02430 [Acidobacteriia bacterium]|nr:hypothetical protein [Terriglobia bacterium]
MNGRNTVGHSRSAIKRFEFTSDAKWSDQRLITEAQSNFHASVNWRETSWPAYSASAPPTFLFELARLLQERARRASGRYVYNEQEYRLELEVEQPERRGNKPGQMLAGRGRVQNLRTGRRTDFRLGLEDSPKAIVPFRIEFQPRSFLRLTFEAVGAPGS